MTAIYLSLVARRSLYVITIYFLLINETNSNIYLISVISSIVGNIYALEQKLSIMPIISHLGLQGQKATYAFAYLCASVHPSFCPSVFPSVMKMCQEPALWNCWAKFLHISHEECLGLSHDARVIKISKYSKLANF